MLPFWPNSDAAFGFNIQWACAFCLVYFGCFLCFGSVTWLLCYLRDDRIHWFEFHETKYCPEVIRRMLTLAIAVNWDMWGLGPHCGSFARTMASEIANAVKLGGYSAARVLDVCSGTGGPTPIIHSVLCGELRAVRTVMSDLFPENAIWKAVAEANNGLTFCGEPVDAMDTAKTKSLAKILNADFDTNDSTAVESSDVLTLRTMFGSFHHFKPLQNVAMLSDAIQHGHGFIICEAIARRKSVFDFFEILALHFFTLPVVIPLMCAELCASKKDSVLQKVWNCVLLVATLPFWLSVFLHDAVISSARTYSLKQLRALPRMAMARAQAQVWRPTAGLRLAGL